MTLPAPVSSTAARLRWFCVAATVLFLAYCLALSIKSVAGFPAQEVTHTFWPWLGDKPVGEDGFYMLEIADNLARTGHITYTYGMPTTGIQPLATIVFAGLAWLNNHAGDRWTLVRVILLFGSLLFLVFSWLLARFAASLALPDRRPLVFTLAYFLLLFDVTLWRLFTYGLETGLYLLSIVLIMLAWRRLVTRTGNVWGNAVMIGLAGGLAGEARIDFGLLLAFLLVYMVWQRYATAVQALVTGLIALAMVSPWFLFVHSVDHAWFPSSGKAESLLIGVHDLPRLKLMALSMLAHLAPWSFAASATLPTDVLALLSAVLLVWLALHSRQTRHALRTHLRPTFAPWAAGIACLLAVYVLLFWSAHFYARYASPMLIVTLPLLALALAEQPWVRQRTGLVLAALVLLWLGLDAGTMHSGKVANNILAAGYIHQYYPKVPVGAFQSGVNGYFDENVINLDGKVNTQALAAAQAHRLPQYIDATGINVMVDWPGYIETLPHDYLARNWEPCPIPMPSPISRCYQRKAQP